MKIEIFNALLWIFLYLGIAAMGYLLMLRLLRHHRDVPFTVVLPMQGSRAETEALYAEHLRLLLSGEGKKGRVVALDLGLPEKEKDICIAFCRSTEGLIYATPETLPALLTTIQKE